MFHAESDSKPSCALVHVVDKIPHQFLELAAKSILLESGQQQGEAKTVVALQVIASAVYEISLS